LKILIIKLSALGDIVHTFPAISYLRARFPEAQIDWAVSREAAILVESHPEIHRAIVIDSKGWKRSLSISSLLQFRRKMRQTHYDILFDLQGNLKSGWVTATCKADRKIGFASPFLPEWPNKLATRERFLPPKGGNIRMDYLATVAAAFNEPPPEMERSTVELRIDEATRRQLDDLLRHPHLLGRKVVMVSPGSAWKNKCVTFDALLDFLQRLSEREELSFLWVWGSSDERLLVERLALHFPLTSLVLPKLPLPALQNIMGRVDRLIAMDSLPLHLCGTTGTPTLSVFGPSNAEKYRPLGERHKVIQGECPYNRSFELRCPKLRTCSTGLCTRGLSGEQIYQSIQPPPKTRSPS
jgi:lipopolysaccharide heptosyltransferase I